MVNKSNSSNANTANQQELASRLARAKSELKDMALFAEKNPSPLIRFDIDGNIVMSNSAAVEVLGENTLPGVALSSVLPEAKYLDLSGCVERGDVFLYSVSIGDKAFQFTIRGIPELCIGHIYASDITEHKQAAKELAVQNELMRVAISTLDFEETFERVKDRINDVIDFDEVVLFHRTADRHQLETHNQAGHALDMPDTIPVEGTSAGDAFLSGKAVVHNNLPSDSPYPKEAELASENGIRSVMWLPLTGRGGALGVMGICSRESGKFGDEEVRFAQQIGDHVAIIIGHHMLYEESRDMAVLEERNRIARDIHDSIAQGLTGIIWQLNALDRMLPDSVDEKTLTLVERIRSIARDSLQEARRSVWDLRSDERLSESLTTKLRQEIEKIGGDSIEASLNVEGTERVLPSGTETALLRICQESLANVIKYAQANRVIITLRYDPEAISLKVSDNGVGFDSATPSRNRSQNSGGFGLINMRERSRLLGGELSVESEPGHGTVVEAVLPLKIAQEGSHS